MSHTVLTLNSFNSMHPRVLHRVDAVLEPREASTPKLLPRSLNAALITTFKQTVKRPGDAKEFNYTPAWKRPRNRKQKAANTLSTRRPATGKEIENERTISLLNKVLELTRMQGNPTRIRYSDVVSSERRLPAKGNKHRKSSCRNSIEKHMYKQVYVYKCKDLK